MTNTAGTEFESHDFSAVNAYADTVSSATLDRSRRNRATRFSTYAKYASLVIVAGGFAGLLILWGLSFLNDPRIVTETKIIEKPVSFEPNIYITNPNQLDRTRSNAEQRVSELATSTGSSPDLFDYVIFEEIKLQRGGLESIQIGMRYANSNDQIPSSQWCYVSKNTSSLLAHNEQVTLAVRDAKETSMTEITDEHALRLGVSTAILREAQKLCRFR
jgi:hypothetical protein